MISSQTLAVGIWREVGLTSECRQSPCSSVAHKWPLSTFLPSAFSRGRRVDPTPAVFFWGVRTRSPDPLFKSNAVTYISCGLKKILALLGVVFAQEQCSHYAALGEQDSRLCQCTGWGHHLGVNARVPLFDCGENGAQSLGFNHYADTVGLSETGGM